MRKHSPVRRLVALISAICMMAGVLALFPVVATADTASTYENPAIDPETNTYNFDENIILSIFWPPTPNYVNDEQYKLIADACMNWVMGAGEESLSNPEMQAAMLELCAKYGLGMTISDGNFGDNLPGRPEEEIAEYVKVYDGVPGAYGFYMRDEPVNPNLYVDAYIALKKANPNAYMHLNFLPFGSYPSPEAYYAQMNDWCVLCAEGGYPVDYLIFDHYPFFATGGMNREGFMKNLRICHDVALDNGVRTGTYIQTVGIAGAYRRPSDSEIRYEMYLALAFGYKQLSFFTWFTPVGRGAESFQDGIISPTGVPNAHYETIKTINHEILNIGTILAKCEAHEIYLNGETWGQPSIPEDFFAQPTDSKNYTVSFLRHKQTGANYLMVVNNDYSNAQSITLTLDKEITSLSEVSRDDGSLKPLTMDGQNLTVELAAGDAMLIALPEGYDHYAPDFTENPAPGTNLATLPEASITATNSQGGNGWYINLLTDGKRMSGTATKGWSTTAGKEGCVTIDLGAVRDINRVDLYPEGIISRYGKNFPKNFEVSISENGTDYTTVATITNCEIQNRGITVAFDTTAAQYVRLTIPASSRSENLSEIEVYYDDGSVGEIPLSLFAAASTDPVDYNEGDNIALKKPTHVSSSVPDSFMSAGWPQSYINDGIKSEGNGFSSNVSLHRFPNSNEYVIIDLGDLFALEKVTITPCGTFPEDYQVQVSTDGENWTDIYSVKGAEIPTEDVNIIPEDGTVPARFLRFEGTKLRMNNKNDGYLFQFREIQAFGAPICDKTQLEAVMSAYVAAGFDTAAEVYVAAEAGMADTTLTQSQANALVKAIQVLLPPPVVEEETEASTMEPAESETTVDTVAETLADTAETQELTDVTAAETAENTEQDTAEATTSGCSSVMSAGMLFVLMAPAFLLHAITKKERTSKNS